MYVGHELNAAMAKHYAGKAPSTLLHVTKAIAYPETRRKMQQKSETVLDERTARKSPSGEQIERAAELLVTPCVAQLDATLPRLHRGSG